MNGGQAHVKSFQSLLELRGNLALFRSDTQQTLDSVCREIGRMQERLEERRRHWRREIERAQELMLEERSRLERSKNGGQRDSSPAYADACRRLRRAEEELRTVAHWQRAAAEAMENYQRQAVRLQQQLDDGLPKAEAFLHRKVEQLEAYRAENPAAGGAFSGASPAGVQTAAEVLPPEDIVALLLQIAADNPTAQQRYQAYLEQLPQAIRLILAVTPDALGLVKFSSLRDMKAGTILKSRLANRNKSVAGFLYELLGTAALLRFGSKAGNGGRHLFIQPETDRLDFSIKFNPKELTGNRRSVEADLLIYRRVYENGRWIDGEEIGIDFKHTLHGIYSGRLKEFQEQIEGIKNVLRTGQLHEFHFVSNGKFTEKFKETICNANTVLENDAIFYHEQVAGNETGKQQ